MPFRNVSRPSKYSTWSSFACVTAVFTSTRLRFCRRSSRLRTRLAQLIRRYTMLPKTRSLWTLEVWPSTSMSIAKCRRTSPVTDSDRSTSGQATRQSSPRWLCIVATTFKTANRHHFRSPACWSSFTSSLRLSFEIQQAQKAYDSISSLKDQCARWSRESNASLVIFYSETVVRMSAPIWVHRRASSTSLRTKWKFIPHLLINAYKIDAATSFSTTSHSDWIFYSMLALRRRKNSFFTLIILGIITLTCIIVASSSWNWMLISKLLSFKIFQAPLINLIHLGIILESLAKIRWMLIPSLLQPTQNGTR